MAKLLDGTRIYGSANIDNNLIVNTMNVVPTIVAAFGQANTANTTSVAAFAQANSANLVANLAYDKANTANVFATSAFDAQNVTSAVANAAFNKANTANITADVAFARANAANLIANLAFDKANTANVIASGAYDKANAANIIAASAYDFANTRLSANGGTITGSLTVSGNLTISGNTVFNNVTTYRIDDPLIYLASNNYTSDLVDIGFIANYVNVTGSNVHTGLMRDAGSKEYYLFQGYDKEPENNHIDVNANNFTISFLNANVRSTNIILSGINVANWITSAYDQANVSSTIATSSFNAQNVTSAVANASFNKANTANITADSAFARANAANLIANLAYDKANTANVFAVAAFGRANTANITADSAFARANAANLIANLAYDKANTANITADASFARANAANLIANLAYDKANTANITADAAFARANAANLIANLAFDKANTANVTACAAFAAANTMVMKAGNTMTGNLVFSGANITFLSSTVAFSNLGIYFSNTPTSGIESAIYANSANILVFATQKLERVRIDAGGRLNVGTIDIVQFSTAAYDTSNAAFGRANAANLIANLAYDKANTANITADASFARANAANLIANLAYDKANTANITADSAFARANAANLIANLAYDKANTANVTACAAFTQANTANTTAVAAFAKANLAAPIASPTFTGTVTAPSPVILLKQLDPLEGGEIDFEKSSSSSISGNLVVDLYTDRFRIFEATGTNRGFFLDITKANTGVGGEILHTNNWFNFISTSGSTDLSGVVFKVGNTMTGNLVMSGANITFATATNSGIYWGGTGLSFIYSPAANTLVFGTSSTEDMRIDSSGNVGIRTGTPTATLDVNGNFAITGTASRITGDFTSDTLNDRASFQTRTSNGNTNVFVLPNGLANISSWSVFNNSNPTNSSFGGIRIDGYTSEFQLRSSITGSGSSYFPMTFLVGGAERMRIDNSGNVGIGTASPLYKFHLESLTATSLGTYIVANASINPPSLGGGNILRLADANTSTDSVSGLGFSSYDTTSVVRHGAQIMFGKTSSWTGGGGVYPGYLSFWTRGFSPSEEIERMRIDANGNVGIGTTAPAATLDVVGSFSDAKANTLSQTLTDGASIAWDASLGRVAVVTLGGARSLANATNLRVGTYILRVQQNTSGGSTLTFGRQYKFTANVAPTLTSAANSVDIFSFVSDGTNMYGAMIPDVRS